MTHAPIFVDRHDGKLTPVPLVALSRLVVSWKQWSRVSFSHLASDSWRLVDWVCFIWPYHKKDNSRREDLLNIMTFKSMIKLFFLRYYELWTSIQSTIRLQVGRFKMFDVHSYLRVWVPLGLTFFSQGDTVATTHQHPPTRNIGLVNLIIHGRSISLESSWVIPFNIHCFSRRSVRFFWDKTN